LRVLVTGNRGMLVQDLVPVLKGCGYDVHCADREDLDISQEEHVHRAVESCLPKLLINCAAYTEVDNAETQKDRAFAVNRDGAGFLAEACAKLEIPVIHLSTDYVFDGDKRSPYLEDDPVNPLSIYGLSKWEGEQAIRSRTDQHIIIRTSWLFGCHGRNFVKTIIAMAREKDELRVVSDQEGCPTWTGHMSNALALLAGEILRNKKAVPWGTYHYCGVGNTTWYDFALRITEEAKKRAEIRTVRVKPIRTSEFPTPAKRPAWSVLDCAKIERTFQIRPRPWLEGLLKVLDTLLGENPPKVN